ncbi:MAG: RIP metalloprotease RseP [Thermoleophilia bacterium]|nr:RIP metalloprotease RseP [Thermoleophilia bacterium]
MLSTFVAIVVSVVGLGFLILAHEFGHFIVAKATGMRVEEFSIGFGRYLVSKRIGETVYGISVLPLGGYVRVTGMHREEFEARAREAEMEAVEEQRRLPRDPEDRLAGPRALGAREIAATPLERRYYAHPFWHKLLFIIAGVAMNALVAFFLVYAAGLAQGETVTSTVVEQVEAGTPAASAGLVPGDRIVEVANRQTPSWEDVRAQILTHPDETVSVVVERNGERVSLTARLEKRADGTGYLGVLPVTEHRSLGVLDALAYAGRTTGSMFWLVLRGMGMMFTGQVPVTGSQGLAGPVGIIQISAQAVEGGYYLMLLALISINLAILNMLPLLPLDGGHVLFSIIERIRGKSISLRAFERISMVGFALFVLLFLVATSNDIGRIFGG